jgi:ketosteroid isomerase-like protein
LGEDEGLSERDSEGHVDVQQLSDLYEIQRLKSRYFRYMDLKQWDEWRDLFTDDLEFFIEAAKVPEATTPTFNGADALLYYMQRADRQRLTIHHGHMPDIEFVDENNATGIWAMYDWVDDHERGNAFQGYGHYHERYRRCDDGRWRICSVHLTRLRTNSVATQPSETVAMPSARADGPRR